MPHDKVDRKTYGKNSSQQFKRITNRDKDKPRNMKSETTEYNLVVQDFVINYKLPADSKVIANGKAVQKRKLSSDHNEWDWAPYPRRAKSQRNDVSLYETNGYWSDEFDTSQVVPHWGEKAERGSSCILSCVDEFGDSLNLKATEIQIVTIDEVIEFDNLKSPSESSLDEEPMCFDIDKLCEIIGSDEADDLAKNKQKNAVDVLFTLTNNSQLVVYQDGEKMLEEVKQSEPYSPLLFDSCEVDDFQDQWQNDCQIEEFKLARCFKCRRKVIGE